MNKTKIAPLVIKDMEERVVWGKNKYGKYLTTNNGRDALQDLYEELMDACMYIRQKIEEERS